MITPLSSRLAGRLERMSRTSDIIVIVALVILLGIGIYMGGIH